jgi:two-component sensor histidine kinase
MGDNVHELFDESKNRVSAMALIHEKLYQSKDLVKIDLNEYLSGLTEIHEQR